MKNVVQCENDHMNFFDITLPDAQHGYAPFQAFLNSNFQVMDIYIKMFRSKMAN